MDGGLERPPGHLQNNVSSSDLKSTSSALQTNEQLHTQPQSSTYQLIVGLPNPTHVQLVLDVAIPVFTTTFAHTCSKADMEEYITSNFTFDKMLAELNNPNKRFILALAPSGECAGFAHLTIGSTEPCLSHIPTSDMVELQRIYVGLAHHGSGLGKLLMDSAISIGQKEGFEWVWLGVYEENKRAKRFYEKLGFEMVGTHEFWLGSDRQIDEIYLRKVVPEPEPRISELESN